MSAQRSATPELADVDVRREGPVVVHERVGHAGVTVTDDEPVDRWRDTKSSPGLLHRQVSILREPVLGSFTGVEPLPCTLEPALRVPAKRALLDRQTVMERSQAHADGSDRHGRLRDPAGFHG